MTIGEITSVLRRQVGNQEYYFGTIESDKLKGVTFVPVVEQSGKTYLNEQTTEGYQRPGSRSRMRLFMSYLRDHPNAVVPPIILSGRAWRFESSGSDPNYGRLLIDGPAAIIDGQHRAGGYIALLEEAEQKRPVDFIVLVGLDVDAEKTEFLTVNTTQKGVPKSLTAYLEGSLEAELAWLLNSEDDSPFKGRIARTGMSREKLFALHSVAKNIQRTFDHGKLVNLDADTKLDYLTRYWTIISDELEEEWSDIKRLDDPESKGKNDFDFKLLELTGFIVWSLLGPEILGRSYVEGMGMNWDNVRKLVRTCGRIDWSKTGKYIGRTGEAGARAIKQDMERLLPADSSPVQEDEGH